jgi:peptidoglycan/LPS O-acetylase OafA/YrhL
MSVSAPKHLWRALAVCAALLFAYATVLGKLGHDWWTDENYSHGLLSPFVIGYILWTNRERLKDAPERPSLMWGGAAILCALLALWAGVAGAELYTQRVSLVLMLAGIVVYFGVFRNCDNLGAATADLAIGARLNPHKIAFLLQIFAEMRRLVDAPVHFGLRQGNVIELLPRGCGPEAGSG